MLHRLLGVVVVFSLAAQAAMADDLAIVTAEPHPAPSTLALFALGVALLGIGLLYRRSDRPRSPKD
jgi:hypothetical protein